MTTPAIMLGLLVAPLLIGGVVNRVAKRDIAHSSTLGCMGITLVFCFTGAGHFIQTVPMAKMLPVWLWDAWSRTATRPQPRMI